LLLLFLFGLGTFLQFFLIIFYGRWSLFFWGGLGRQNLLLTDNKALLAFGADDFFARCWGITHLQFGETIGTLDRIKI
jgi:hypothetical protein